ncbi:TPA: restriction endonuclease subunit S, partial [Streptococcus pyogenes]
WEDCKLGELASFSKGNGYTKNDLVEFGDPIILYGRLYTKYETVIEKVDTFVNKKDKSIISEGSEVIVPASGESSEDISRASVVGKSGIILGGDLNIIKPINYIDSIFLALTISNGSQQKEMSRRAQGKSVVHLHNSDLKQVNILYPKLEEQQKIGSFFKQLDNTIALHQRKLDLLKEQKKGYLQKMFPKNGAKVPELRFAGFADDWEERKLSDVANHRGGTAIEKYFDKDGVYKVISIGSYGLNSQYVDQNIRAISNEITDGRVVNSGELTMVLNDKTANGTIIGRSLLVEQDNEYVINQRTEIISPKETFDSNFAYTILNGSFREKVKRIVQGGTQIYVNYSAVSNLSLELPKIEEQQKIGSFFKQLDNTIALHQRKLDLLKEQKKGFLQKMFV